MSRYVIKFYKEGYIRYTSHLDILRLFKRSFKRTGIKLQYSQGFNPHPKMSFAQPLSLGYSSISEYLEFETAISYAQDFIKEVLNSVMPEGLGILSCEELKSSGKTLAAITESASYEIIIPGNYIDLDISSILDKYLLQDLILVKKFQRKTGKEVEMNIKSMIKEISGNVDDNYIMLNVLLSAGSKENLSPELVLSSFCNFSEIVYDRSEIEIKRTEIYFSN